MGLLEFVVIGVIGLLVIGPERLPSALKTAMIWIGRMKRLMTETRVEIEQQLGMDEIRREIHNQEVLDSLKSLNVIKDQAQKTSDDINEEMRKTAQNIELDKQAAQDDEGQYGDQWANHDYDPEKALAEHLVAQKNAPTAEATEASLSTDAPNTSNLSADNSSSTSTSSENQNTPQP
ncbi:MAG: twin-arginine translocase subunit TatB [Alteromonadaceae bacterium]|nr:MAG: twin-arginine translocase subunit TatB [Alteromonadaceae bacterium]